jgi:hypothetical protein
LLGNPLNVKYNNKVYEFEIEKGKSFKWTPTQTS